MPSTPTHGNTVRPTHLRTTPPQSPYLCMAVRPVVVQRQRVVRHAHRGAVVSDRGAVLSEPSEAVAALDARHDVAAVEPDG
eukprot:366534-Chlamydomonas_euryale.AAC.2